MKETVIKAMLKIIGLLLIIAFSLWITKAIWSADMPTWLKIWFLS